MNRDNATKHACRFFLSEFPDDKTGAELIDMIRNNDEAIVVWEPFERYDAEWLIEQIEGHAIDLPTPLSMFEWIEHGYRQGYCGPDVCETHDGVPMSEAEHEEFSEGGDPCIAILRLYNDPGHKAAIEADHSPSQWRASNSGLS